MMHNPIAHWSPSFRKTVLLYFGGLNLGTIWVMISISQVLQPHSIIDFELAGTFHRAQQILSTWQENNAMNALFFLLGFDYFFIITYSVGLWFACLHVASKYHGKFQVFLVVLAWLQPLAGLLDAVENGALYHLASGSTDQMLPAVAKFTAIPKFVIALAGVIFWIGCSFISSAKKN
ncbi:hypothetical protein [Pseudochryseolinea flava]|uniref:DUF4386 domain-containing protein n=1 Tax=Pseudochryseolinea flava TaxID=2059302 RepID=A0A364Y0K3_9BACT|nr:hypothetical protein [Pseudochryseolinea flava]RAW00128.1 hypothetical protein DQQ10_16400 [Pseudochryseolinea flava]